MTLTVIVLAALLMICIIAIATLLDNKDILLIDDMPKLVLVTVSML